MSNSVVKWLLASVVVVGGATTLVAATGCSKMMPCHAMAGMHNAPGASEAPAASDEPAAKPVNTVCPIMGGKVNPSLTRQFSGKTVGFCCGGCLPKWDKLSDDEKQAKLDKVLSK